MGRTHVCGISGCECFLVFVSQLAKGLTDAYLFAPHTVAVWQRGGMDVMV